MRDDDRETAGAATLARIRRRLLPFTFLLYIAAYLDRINVGFAALQMNHDLRLGDAAFGLGAGLFFVGYFIFEIPSNLILHRVGARPWLARIMITWGAVAISMAAVRGAPSFYLLRFMLGAAEAGFFPGIILYLTYWFPTREQARSIALFMTASALAGVIGGPLSGAILKTRIMMGLSAWQWLFILEGLPSVILGVSVLFYLPNGPQDASWLAENEKSWLAEKLTREAAGAREHTPGGALTSRTIWMLGMLYFMVVTALYGVGMWLPQIVKGLGALSDLQAGIVSAIPFFAAAVAMVLIARSSDRRAERRKHLAVCTFAGAAGLTASALAHNPPMALAALSIGAAGIWGVMGPFWSMAAENLSGAGAAAGIALINSVGNLGGFIGPYLVGIVKQVSHSFSGGLAAMALVLMIAGLFALTIPGPRSGAK